jgi:DNA adenine methylase
MYDEDFQPQLPAPKPVIGWPGGKTRMLKHILPLIPEHTQYCEVFGGGLAVFLAKPPSHLEVINDINGDLVAFYRNAKLHLEALLGELDLVLNSREEFEAYAAQPGLTEIQRAARWFIRNKLSFGGMGETFAITRTQPLSSRNGRLIAIRSLSRRLDRTTIEHRSWDKILDTYDHAEAFFFLDPPYLDSGGAAYDGWDEVTLQRFCTRVQALRGKWMLTFQDCAQIRTMMAGYSLKAITRANGIGNKQGRKGRTYAEVIITSTRSTPGSGRKERSA